MKKKFNNDQICGGVAAQEVSTNQSSQGKQIYDFCFDYGYDWISAEAEYPDIEYKDEMIYSVLCEEPDDFFYEFGEDAEWDYGAMYAGMAEALKDFSGKAYKVDDDGYRVLAISEDSTMSIKTFSHQLDDSTCWDNAKLF